MSAAKTKETPRIVATKSFFHTKPPPALLSLLLPSPGSSADPPVPWLCAPALQQAYLFQGPTTRHPSIFPYASQHSTLLMLLSVICITLSVKPFDDSGPTKQSSHAQHAERARVSAYWLRVAAFHQMDSLVRKAAFNALRLSAPFYQTTSSTILPWGEERKSSSWTSFRSSPWMLCVGL